MKKIIRRVSLILALVTILTVSIVAWDNPNKNYDKFTDVSNS